MLLCREMPTALAFKTKQLKEAQSLKPEAHTGYLSVHFEQQQRFCFGERKRLQSLRRLSSPSCRPVALSAGPSTTATSSLGSRAPGFFPFVPPLVLHDCFESLK